MKILEFARKMRNLDRQEDAELSMDGSGELGGRIMEVFDQERDHIMNLYPKEVAWFNEAMMLAGQDMDW